MLARGSTRSVGIVLKMSGKDCEQWYLDIHFPQRHNATPFSEPTARLLTSATAALNRPVAPPTGPPANGPCSSSQPPLLYAACRHTPQCVHPLAGLDNYRWPELRQAQNSNGQRPADP